MPDQKSKVKTILLWIALLPASLLAMGIAFYSWKLLDFITGSYFEDAGSIYVVIYSNIVAGAALVYVAFLIAPSHKKFVAIAMSGLLLVMSGASILFIYNLTSEYSTDVGLIFRNIGSILCCIGIYKKEIED